MKAWFLDQFGVLHDGKQPYPGAISTCEFPLFVWHFLLTSINFALHCCSTLLWESNLGSLVNPSHIFTT